MTTSTTLDPDEPAPGVERTTVLAVDDPEARAVRRALGALAAVRIPGLAPLVRWTSLAGGVALTHRVPADAVDLGTLRRAGPLRSGHVLAVGVAVLEALDELHRAGLAHGAVDAGSVLVGPDGAVVLGGCGAAWAPAPGEPGGPAPADDVAAVGELLRDLLGPASAPGPLVVAIVRAVDPDLALRPDARSLLETLRRCGRPDPLLELLWRQPRSETEGPSAPGEPVAPDGAASEVDEPAPALAPVLPVSPRALRPVAAPPRRRTPRRSPMRRPARGQGRLFVLLGLAGAVIGTAYAVLAASGGAGQVGSAGAPAPAVEVSRAAVATAPDEDWAAVLGALDDRRTAALASGSAERLAEVATGTAYAADLALLRSIAASDARLEGGTLVLEDVAPVSVAGTTAVLRVRDRRGAYAVVVGSTRQAVPERPARTWTITLVRDAATGTWRVAEVADAAISPAGRR